MPLDRLDKLRAEIKRIEGHTSSLEEVRADRFAGQSSPQSNLSASPAWSFGAMEVDQCLGHGLAPHALHEINPRDYKDCWAALSFALALASKRADFDQRPLLWCSSRASKSEYGGLYGQGLQRFNLDPARFILIETKNDNETLFVLEEALKSARLCAVIGLIAAPGLTASRRLSLMADKGQTPALLVTKPGDIGIKNATTRWQIAGLSTDQSLFSTPSLPQLALPQLAWQVALTRNRQGPADKKWHLEFPSYEQPLHKSSKKAFRFALPSPFRNRKSQAAA